MDKEPLKAVGVMVAHYESEIEVKQKFIEELVRKRGERQKGEEMEEKQVEFEKKPEEDSKECEKKFEHVSIEKEIENVTGVPKK